MRRPRDQQQLLLNLNLDDYRAFCFCSLSLDFSYTKWNQKTSNLLSLPPFTRPKGLNLSVCSVYRYGTPSVCLCAWRTYMCVELGSWWLVSSSEALHFRFWDDQMVSHWTWSSPIQPGWPMNQAPSVSTPLALGLLLCFIVPGFYLGARDTSCPHSKHSYPLSHLANPHCIF